jgi:DNA-binding response OmpR family regulator
MYGDLPPTLAVVVNEYSREQGQVWVKGKRIGPFSDEECAVLHCLVLNGNKTVGRDEIAVAVRPKNSAGVSKSEISRWISRLRTEIEDDPSNPKTILTVKGQGYTIPFDYKSIEIREFPPTLGMDMYFTKDRMDLLERRAVGSVYVLGKGEVQLTVGEYNVLEYLILNRGRTVSYAEISDEVWIKHGRVGAVEIDNTVRELRK